MTSPPVALSPAVFSSSEIGRLAALRLRLAVIGGVLVLVALAVAMALIWHEREAALADARTGGANLALVLARQADALLQAADGRMSGLRTHLAKGKGGSAGEEAEARLDSLAFAAHLQRRAARLSPRQTLLAVTAGGRIAAASAVVMPCQAAWIGREVRAMAAETADRPRLREVPAGCDPPALLLIRPLRMALRAPEAPASSPSGWGDPAPGSRFSGALGALIRPDDLLVFPPAITLAEGGFVSLLDADGRALVRRNVGRAELPPSRGIPLARVDGTFPERASLTLPGPDGGSPSLVALHALADPALAVVVGVDRDAVLAGWRHDAGLIAAVTGICILCILLLLAALQRQLRQVAFSQASLLAANASLSRKSHELETTLSHMDQGLLMVDAQCRIVVVNARAAEILSLPEELIAARPSLARLIGFLAGRGEHDLLPAELQTRILAGTACAPAQVSERRRADGRLLEMRTAPVVGGGLVCTYTDVTARALEDERFRQIVHLCPLAIALIDMTSGRLEQVNPACCRLLGRPEAALVGRPWQQVVHPDERAAVPPSSGADVRLLHGNGGTVLAHLTRARLPASHGSPPLAMVLGTDVTHQRDIEARLRQAQRLEAVGQLTGGVAHDFNNLLGIIVLDAELLEEKLRETPELLRLAEEILGAAASGAELIHRLLAFARRQALQPRPVELGAVVAESVGLLRRPLGEAVTVRIAPAAEPIWPVSVDPSQLGDALLNLALNARDAMPHGGEIVITLENRTIPPAGASADLPEGDYVALSVRDNGRGMTREVLERAVEPFFTTKPAGAGSGLGLSMIYGFARQSGGALTLESAPGRGTMVCLLLPRATGMPPVESAEATPTRLPGGSEAVLLVDDNAAVRRVTARLLAGLGYRVREAADSAEALALLQAGEPADLLLTDLVLTGDLDGEELARAALSLRPALKLLYTTGHPRPVVGFPRRESGGGRSGPAGTTSGLVPLICKPYRRRELAEQVRAVLDGRLERVFDGRTG